MSRASSVFHQDQAAPIGAPDHLKPTKEAARQWLLAPVAAISAFLWWLPPPIDVSIEAWRLLLIFLATLVGIILRPFPMGAVALFGLTTATVTGALPMDKALAGFASPQIWLVVMACFISRGFIKTGLASRIAYLFLYAFGRSPSGVAYGLILSDLVLAPAVPSNTARAGGILAPILKSISQALGSRPEDGTANRIGSFLSLSMFHGGVVTSAMFITAMAANPIIVKLAAGNGIEMSWTLWAKAALVPGLVSLLVIPPLIRRVTRPTLKDMSEGVSHAHERLSAMGAVRPTEWLMFSAFVILLTLWIFGKYVGIDATQAAMVGLVFLLISGVLTWRDILAEELAWDVLIWLSVLVTLASQLTESGLVAWFSAHVVSLVARYQWPVALAILALIYFYSHYFFASITAHVTSMFAPFMAVALAVGAPPLPSALLLGFFSGLFGGLTHYGTGPAPVIFALRYVSLKAWWGVGAVMSIVNILIWSVVGGLWWKWLGIW